jgi:hypothetical protein
MRIDLSKSFPIVAALVGALLYLAAIDKSLSPRDTLVPLDYVFGPTAAPWVFRALLMVEIVIGSVLLAQCAPRVGLGTAALLFTAFTGWIVYLILTDAPVGCGCGGVRFTAFDKFLPLARSSALACVCGIAFLKTSSRGGVKCNTRGGNHEEQVAQGAARGRAGGQHWRRV